MKTSDDLQFRGVFTFDLGAGFLVCCVDPCEVDFENATFPDFVGTVRRRALSKPLGVEHLLCHWMVALEPHGRGMRPGIYRRCWGIVCPHQQTAQVPSARMTLHHAG